MTAFPSTASTREVEAALLLLERMGIKPDQLVRSAHRAAGIPTFGEYIDRVRLAVSEGTRGAYGCYWKRIRQWWEHRRLNEPTTLEITALVERTRADAVHRRNSCGGRSAAEHMVSAFRCIYRYAVADGYIAAANNPAARVAKPRRLSSSRRALLDHQLDEIIQIAWTTGNDPELDSLMLRLHTETACRRGGALALRLSDLDQSQSLIRLHEKGETTRWQPVSPTLMQHLIAHAEDRGGTVPDSSLLRYRNGRPISARRYDYLWERLGRHLPWVTTQQVSTHWLRHTTLTWVERNFGYAVARAYAGHNGRSDAGTTASYVRATLYEVATALAELTNEDHPLVQGQRPVALQERGFANVSPLIRIGSNR